MLTNLGIAEIYQGSLLVTILASIWVTRAAYKAMPKPGAKWLGLFMVSVIALSTVLIINFSTSTIAGRVFWSKMGYIAFAGAITFFLFFAMEFSGAEKYFSHPYWLFYLIVPVIVLALVWTNEWHGLIWNSFTWRDPPDNRFLIFGRGALFPLFVVYGYVMLLVSSFFLFRSVLGYRYIYRRQAVIIMAAMVAPWVAHFIYIFKLGPAGLDTTPFGLTLTGVLLALNISRWHLLDLSPVARDWVIEEMQQGVIIVDDRLRLIDMNPAARTMLNLKPADLGQPLTGPIADWTSLSTVANASHEVEWPGPPTRVLSVTNSVLSTRRHEAAGYLLLCHDITETKQTREALWQRNLELAVLEERETLSRDLYAETSHILSRIVSLGHEAINFLEHEHNVGVAAALAELVEIAGSSETNLDAFIRNRPPDAGMPDYFELLARYTDHFSQSHPLTVTLTHPPRIAGNLLSPMAQIQLLRMIQETLLHTVLVVSGKSAQIIISEQENWVQTVIVCLTGATDTLQQDERSLLSLLQTRVETVGGVVDIRATSGRESHLVIQLPRYKTISHKNFSAMRVLLVDDHQILLDGFKRQLEEQGINVVGTANNGLEAIDQARRLTPDIILMDIRMPQMSGIEATRRIKAEFPDIKIIMLTVSQSQQDLLESLRSGASGYLLKTIRPKEFFDLLASVVDGDIPLAPDMVSQLMVGLSENEEVASGMLLLSSQQLDILRLVAQGLTYQEVADRVSLSIRTVHYHMAQIREKLNATSRSEVVSQAMALGLVSPNETQK